MRSKLVLLLKSNALFALIIYIFVTAIIVITALSFNFINPIAIAIVAAGLYFLSGAFLSKRKVSFLSLFSIIMIISLLGIFDYLSLFLFHTEFDIIPMDYFHYVNYLDPYQSLQALQTIRGTPSFHNLPVSETIWILQKGNLLPTNEVMEIELAILLSFITILLLYCGKKVLGNIRLANRVTCVVIAVMLAVNAYVISNPKISVEYENVFGYMGHKAHLNLDENGNYNYSDEDQKVKLKLTKGQMRKIAFGIVYKNMFFKLEPDLSYPGEVTDSSSETLKIKWFGNTKEVGGYAIVSRNFYNITSILNVCSYGYIDPKEKDTDE